MHVYVRSYLFIHIRPLYTIMPSRKLSFGHDTTSTYVNNLKQDCIKQTDFEVVISWVMNANHKDTLFMQASARCIIYLFLIGPWLTMSCGTCCSRLPSHGPLMSLNWQLYVPIHHFLLCSQKFSTRALLPPQTSLVPCAAQFTRLCRGYTCS